MANATLIIMGIGAIFIAIFTIPNLVKVLKTHNTAYVNLPMYIIFTLACLLFAVYGLGMTIDHNYGGGVPELVANVICVIIAIVTLLIKFKNMSRASKLGMSEVEYWKSHYDKANHNVEEAK